MMKREAFQIMVNCNEHGMVGELPRKNDTKLSRSNSVQSVDSFNSSLYMTIQKYTWQRAPISFLV